MNKTVIFVGCCLVLLTNFGKVLQHSLANPNEDPYGLIENYILHKVLLMRGLKSIFCISSAKAPSAALSTTLRTIPRFSRSILLMIAFTIGLKKKDAPVNPVTITSLIETLKYSRVAWPLFTAIRRLLVIWLTSAAKVPSEHNQYPEQV